MIALQEAIALVASDSGDDYEAGPSRHYQYAITYDPQMVTDVGDRVSRNPMRRGA